MPNVTLPLRPFHLTWWQDEGSKIEVEFVGDAIALRRLDKKNRLHSWEFPEDEADVLSAVFKEMAHMVRVYKDKLAAEEAENNPPE